MDMHSYMHSLCVKVHRLIQYKCQAVDNLGLASVKFNLLSLLLCERINSMLL